MSSPHWNRPRFTGNPLNGAEDKLRESNRQWHIEDNQCQKKWPLVNHNALCLRLGGFSRHKDHQIRHRSFKSSEHGGVRLKTFIHCTIWMFAWRNFQKGESDLQNEPF